MAAARAPYGVKAKGLNERRTAPHPSLPHASCPVDHTCFRSPSSQSPLAEVLNLSGLGSTALRCDRAAVNDGTITNDEFTQILQTLKAGLPAEMCDPSSLGRYNFHTRHHPLSHPCTCPLSVLLIHPPSLSPRIRSSTLLPVATAALVCRQHGRSPASLAWLRAFSQPVPDSWVLHEQQEANEVNGEDDLILEEQLDDQSFEVEDVSFRCV